MALQVITQGITGQEAATIISQNDTDVLRSVGYPFQKVSNYDLYPIKRIRFYGSPVEGQSIFLHYFFNREVISGGRRSNLQFDVRDSGGTLLYNIVATGWSSVTSIDTKGLISDTLYINKPGDPLHGKVIGEYTIDADLATYHRENGYGVYNTDDNQSGYNLSPLCWDNIAASGTGDHTGVSLNAFNTQSDNIAKIDNSPFLVAVPEGNNFEGVLNIEIYPDRIPAYDRYALEYLWRNSDVYKGWLIRITGNNEGSTDWVNVGDWQRDEYTPAYLIETLQVGAGSFITVDWRLIPDGSASLIRREIKKSCIKAIQIDENAVLTPGTTNPLPAWLLAAVPVANVLTDTVDKYNLNTYFLAYLWKNYELNGVIYNLIRFGITSPDGNSDNYVAQEWHTTQGDTVETYALKEIRITIDWSKIPDGTAWNGIAKLKNLFAGSEGSQIPEGYGERDTTAQLITVKKDGTGNFTTIGDAYASIKDSSYENQYEVCVYPGVYEEYNLKPPKYTHTHGLAPNTVTVTSKPWNIESTLPVFDQQYASSKLSNMTIDSWTGYCIHYDVALDRCTLVNENLHLIKRYYSGALMAVIGGGSFRFGTKFHWKGCTFEGVGATCEASCHTNGNALNENIHQVFDNCVFVNGYPNIGSVGGFGHCVCEVKGCRFTPGVRGLFTWSSPIRNIEDPTLYLYNTIEWQVIGGGNSNFAPLLYSRGKTLQLEAATPIEISGNAAAVIFGDIPAIEAPGVRYPATLTSMYYIADEKAGMEGYSELRDVFQLWKRLGDCTTVNKTLTVTVNGVTRSHVFKDNYLQTKESQNSIIAKMNTSLTNVTVKAITASGYIYDNINTTDKMYVTVTAADILKGEVVTLSGAKAIDTTPLNDILGFATKNAVQGESVPVWVNAFAPDGGIADGQYGLDANGTLSASAATKIGYAKGNIFYMYR